MRTRLSSGEIEELCSSYCAVYHCEAALNGSVLYEQINMTQCLTVPQSLTNTHRHTHSCSAHSVCVCQGMLAALHRTLYDVMTAKQTRACHESP